MDELQCRRLIERYLRAYNHFDIDGMLALLADGVRFENHSGGQMTMATDGVAAFGDLARQSAGVFSERKQRLVSLAFDGEQATASIAWRGVFAQDVADGPRAGTALELQGQSDFTFAGDRIARIVDRS